MDVNKFTTDKAGGEGYQACRTALQDALNDILAVLQPKPKFSMIMKTEAMPAKVVEQIGACIGTGEDGNPVWTNPAAGKLNPDTIMVYEWAIGYLAAQKPAEPAAESPATEPETNVTEAAASGQVGKTEPTTQDAADAAEDIFVADGQECPGWAKSAGPTNPKYEAICKVCSRLEACKERASEAAAQAPAPSQAGGRKRKTPEEKEAEKQAKAAEKEKKKQERAMGPAEERYGYVHAAYDAILAGDATRDDLAKKMLELYTAKGKTGDLKQARRNLDSDLRSLLVFGVVREEGGKIILVNCS